MKFAKVRDSDNFVVNIEIWDQQPPQFEGFTYIQSDTAEKRSTYDPQTDTFSEPAPPKRVQLTTLEFLDRFTSAERGQIRAAAQSDPSGKVADWLERVRAAQEVDLTDTRTQKGMDVLVSAGLISNTRKDEILTP